MFVVVVAVVAAAVVVAIFLIKLCFSCSKSCMNKSLGVFYVMVKVSLHMLHAITPTRVPQNSYV